MHISQSSVMHTYHGSDYSGHTLRGLPSLRVGHVHPHQHRRLVEYPRDLHTYIHMNTHNIYTRIHIRYRSNIWVRYVYKGMYGACVCEEVGSYRGRRVLKDPCPARCRWTGKARGQGVICTTELRVNLLITYKVISIQNASI